MARDTDHTMEQVLEAAEKGITKTGAAKVLGCSWNSIDRYCKRWKSVDDAFRVKRKELVDLAEMGLRGAVLDKAPWAIAFALKTLGKGEGYTERNELTGKDGEPLIPKQRFDLSKLTDKELDELEKLQLKMLGSDGNGSTD